MKHTNHKTNKRKVLTALGLVDAVDASLQLVVVRLHLLDHLDIQDRQVQVAGGRLATSVLASAWKDSSNIFVERAHSEC